MMRCVSVPNQFAGKQANARPNLWPRADLPRKVQP